MLNKTPLALLVAVFFAATSLSAQTLKYAHMNLGNLVEQLPEVKTANEAMKAFADKLTSVDDSLQKAFQTDYEKLSKDYQAGLLTPLQAQQAQESLEKRQQFIQAFEEDAQKQVAAKREEILTPILAKVQEAIKAVAKENGYAMVFDTSTGAALYALETEDLTPLVKKKLGIQ
jgi:outer membrane protein